MNILESIASFWLNQVELCENSKDRKFGKQARRSWDYLGKDFVELYSNDTDYTGFADGEVPALRARVPKAAEYVSLMLPRIWPAVPDRLVRPSRPIPPPELVPLLAGYDDEMTQAQDNIVSYLLGWYLNYLAGKRGYNLTREMRMMLPEALVCGRGILWHSMSPGTYGAIPASQFESVGRRRGEGLLIDPDCQQLRDANYIIRIRREPIWKLSDRFGIDRDKLRGAYQTAKNREDEYNVTDTTEGNVADIVIWYEVFSRCGVGQKYSLADKSLRDQAATLDEIDNVWLCVLPGLNYPLNMPPDKMEGAASKEINAHMEWPFPFWKDSASPWPFTPLDFLPNDNDPWARGTIAHALPLLKFIDYAYSYLGNRVKKTARDTVVTTPALAEALKEAIHVGYDLEIAECEELAGKSINELVQFLQYPTLQSDLWHVLSVFERAFDRATGMEPGLYGAQDLGASDRSAAQSHIRQQNLLSRPQDMQNVTESFMSDIAAKEGQMTRYFIGAEEIAPLFGEEIRETEMGDQYGPLTMMWQNFVYTDDSTQAIAELNYEVEAGTAQRENETKYVENASQVIQNFMSMATQVAAMGNPEGYNALVDLASEVYKLPLERLKITEFQAVEPRKEEKNAAAPE